MFHNFGGQGTHCLQTVLFLKPQRPFLPKRLKPKTVPRNPSHCILNCPLELKAGKRTISSFKLISQSPFLRLRVCCWGCHLTCSFWDPQVHHAMAHMSVLCVPQRRRGRVSAFPCKCPSTNFHALWKGPAILVNPVLFPSQIDRTALPHTAMLTFIVYMLLYPLVPPSIRHRKRVGGLFPLSIALSSLAYNPRKASWESLPGGGEICDPLLRYLHLILGFGQAILPGLLVSVTLQG